MHYIQSSGKKEYQAQEILFFEVYIPMVKMITTENKQDCSTYQLHKIQTEYRLFSLCCCECTWKL